ncbi:MAG: Signal peptidase I T [Eubacteriales bacterium SKADARSKE-1]|nr:Signal peptidase I T [Eubacteriales bacterium SKADARSKE-1]
MRKPNLSKTLNKKSILLIQKVLFELVELFVNTLILCSIIFSFLAFGVKVSGSSMLPTLQNDDYVFCYKFLYTPKRGDIVIINKPNLIGKNLIKRVIAKEDDSIEIDFDKGLVFVNGELLNEPYINTPTNLEANWNFPKIIPKGKLFVLGDNRNSSLDSRFAIIGLIDKDAILGKAVCIILPFNRISILE